MYVKVKLEDIKTGNWLKIITSRGMIIDVGSVNKIYSCNAETCPTKIRGGCSEKIIHLGRNRDGWCAKNGRGYFVYSENKINRITEI